MLSIERWIKFKHILSIAYWLYDRSVRHHVLISATYGVIDEPGMFIDLLSINVSYNMIEQREWLIDILLFIGRFNVIDLTDLSLTIDICNIGRLTKHPLLNLSIIDQCYQSFGRSKSKYYCYIID